LSTRDNYTNDKVAADDDAKDDNDNNYAELTHNTLSASLPPLSS